MRLALANANYRKNDTRGRNAHIGQFISQAVGMGHEVWAWPENDHSLVRHLPENRVKRLKALRRMDALYIRLQEHAPGVVRYSAFPFRQLLNSPVIAWEFNTVPEFHDVMGRTKEHTERSIQAFRRYGRGCDLAICVSRPLAEYVRERLGIDSVRVVPNGSDPSLFYPDVERIQLDEEEGGHLNVVWIGSAELSWHNTRLMKDAAQLLKERDSENRIRFHVIGRDADFMSEMPNNVRYHGEKAYEVLPRWLAAMDVGLCLYHHGPADYNSPLKLFDYMASGLAVVGTPQPQIREVFDQLDQLDLIVPADEPEALVDILMGLSNDRERVRQLGRAARQLVIEFYNWDRATRDILAGIQLKL